MSKASDIFNAYPFEDRKRLQGAFLEQHIRDIRIEMKRAQEAHRKHMREARGHLKNVERALKKWDQSQ